MACSYESCFYILSLNLFYQDIFLDLFYPDILLMLHNFIIYVIFIQDTFFCICHEGSFVVELRVDPLK